MQLQEWQQGYGTEPVQVLPLPLLPTVMCGWVDCITLGEILVLKFVDDRSPVNVRGFFFFLRRDAIPYETVSVGTVNSVQQYYFWGAKIMFCFFRLEGKCRRWLSFSARKRWLGVTWIWGLLFSSCMSVVALYPALIGVKQKLFVRLFQDSSTVTFWTKMLLSQMEEAFKELWSVKSPSSTLGGFLSSSIWSDIRWRTTRWLAAVSSEQF